MHKYLIKSHFLIDYSNFILTNIRYLINNNKIGNIFNINNLTFA